MKLNLAKSYNEVTHEGGKAHRMSLEQSLRRSVLSCLLFENNAYEEGKAIAERIKELISQVSPEAVSRLAVEAREKMGLRHAPLLILREMARLPTHKRYVSRTLERIITRPDQMTDFLALYWETNGVTTKTYSDTPVKARNRTLSAKVKQGLAHAFRKFDEYSLAKHAHNDRAVKLRDVLFMCHAKPKDEAQADLWKRLVNKELVTPDTWEVALSSGADKKETWTRLMAEKKLGALAFVRNLRNMQQADVGMKEIIDYGVSLKVDKIFPWQFIAAATHAMVFEPLLEAMIFKSLADKPKIKGTTILLVDNSGSMYSTMNAKSQMQYIDAACGIAMLVREQCEDARIFGFSDRITEVPARRGFALRDAIKSTHNGGTYIGSCVRSAQDNVPTADRIIVITDEQSADSVGKPNKRGYMMNVANHQNGVGYSEWAHIDGFSSSVLEWLTQYENEF